MSEGPLKAQFFVTRNDGKMVPLIAIDELPHHITIGGLSRVMSPFDITGMTCVGRSDFRHRNYIVEEASELAASDTVAGKDALKAKYFITRDSGNMVPLVAMDEMPECFVINSVPRSVSVFDIAGMTCVGLADAREGFHQVEDVKNASLAYFTSRSSGGSGSEEGNAASCPGSSSITVVQPIETPNGSGHRTQNNSPFPSLSDADNGFQFVEPLTPRHYTPSMSSVGEFGTGRNVLSRPLPDSLASTTIKSANMPGVKEFCSYWIRHGECDYQQQGCLYRHEMPLDQETLSRLGLRDIPRWYREKHSLGSYLAAGGSGAAFSGQDLKSATATGSHEDDKQNKMASDWRSGPRTRYRTPSPSTRRGNVYNPRPNRPILNPSSFSRLPISKPHIPLFNGKLRRNETLHDRQQFETIQALDSYNKTNANRRRTSPPMGRALAPNKRDRRPSVSTMASDIEASIGREDAVRKAREDAEYARAKGQEVGSIATDSNKSSANTNKSGGTDSRRSSDGSQRGGKSSGGKSRGKGRGDGKTS